MTEISFYYVTKPPLDRILIKILEKIYGQSERSVVASPLAERISILNAMLWTYSQSSFLPHGSAAEADAAHQPIWLTTTVENPNQASVLVIIDNMDIQQKDLFKRVMVLIDTSVPEQMEFARDQVKHYEMQGQKITQWQQSAEGAWAALS